MIYSGKRDIKEFEKINRYWGRSSSSPPPLGGPGRPERRVCIRVSLCHVFFALCITVLNDVGTLSPVDASADASAVVE